VEREPLAISIEIVLALRRHGERPRHRHLDGALGIGPQEFHVAHLDRMLAPDRTDHPRHGRESAGAIRSLAGIVEVDARERGGEAGRIAPAPLLAVGDDVEAGAPLVADGEERGVVLRRLEPRRIDAPEILRAYPRHHLREALAVDQPVRLGIGANQGGGEQHGYSQLCLGCGAARAPAISALTRVFDARWREWCTADPGPYRTPFS